MSRGASYSNRAGARKTPDQGARTAKNLTSLSTLQEPRKQEPTPTKNERPDQEMQQPLTLQLVPVRSQGSLPRDGAALAQRIKASAAN